MVQYYKSNNLYTSEKYTDSMGTYNDVYDSMGQRVARLTDADFEYSYWPVPNEEPTPAEPTAP